MAKLLAKGGDAAVLFSEQALRVNRAGLLKPKTLLAPVMGLNLLSFGSIALGVNRKPVCNPSATKEATKQRANMGKTIKPMVK